MMKTSELTGMALDWAVAKCEGKTYIGKGQLNDFRASRLKDRNSYSVSWAQGGPIIERECIKLAAYEDSSEIPKKAAYWEAAIRIRWSAYRQTGSTALIAAMRCYCYSKLGDEIDIPEELLK